MKPRDPKARAEQVIQRAEARALGLKFYFTGCPCPRGHVAERRTCDRHCLACKRERSLQRNEARKTLREENPETTRQPQREWRRAMPSARNPHWRPTADEIRALISYDPLSGTLTWRTRQGDDPDTKGWNTKHAGTQAGCVNNRYVYVKLLGRRYLAHRLAWLIQTGAWPGPGQQIDHRDGNGKTNGLSNLRLATDSQNGANAKMPSNNTSNYKGVSLTADGRYQAGIKVRKQQIYLGRFDTPEEASAAYWEAAQRYFREFARAA
jgi:hypothetical protein